MERGSDVKPQTLNVRWELCCSPSLMRSRDDDGHCMMLVSEDDDDEVSTERERPKKSSTGR
jgi:hypothetical protein